MSGGCGQAQCAVGAVLETLIGLLRADTDMNYTSPLQSKGDICLHGIAGNMSLSK